MKPMTCEISVQRAESEYYKQELEVRWLTFCQWSGLKRDQVFRIKLFDSLVHHYIHPERHYHNLEHIQYCMTKLEEVCGLVEKFRNLELAIFFHDVIYGCWTEFSQNEEYSARFAKFFITELMGLPSEIANDVCSLIKDTTYHFNNRPKELGNLTHDGEYMMDIDIASLGDNWEVFNRNMDNIAKEFSWVDPKLYKIERIKILKHFLDRDPLYKTNYFRSKYEVRAKLNLVQAIAKLRATA